MKTTNDKLPHLWKEEYTKGGIPSSFRSKPSAAVARFAEFLTLEKLPSLTGVDLGSGTGRNALYLGELGCDITALDFVPDMIADINKNAEIIGISSKVHAKIVDLTKAWGLPNTKYDFFVDTYCFKHIVNLVSREKYKSELINYSKEGTLLLLTLASTEDGYYKQYRTSMDGELQVILDPGNNIESVLYTPEQVMAFFSPAFEMLDFHEDNRANIMHGREYQRKGFEFIFRFNK